MKMALSKPTLEKVTQRKQELIDRFAKCLDAFDRAVVFAGPSLHFHHAALAKPGRCTNTPEIVVTGRKYGTFNTSNKDVLIYVSNICIVHAQEQTMPQLHLSVDERTAEELADRAEARGESLSKYLASLVKRDIPNEWPKRYLASIVGSCADNPIEAPADLPLDEIEL